MAAIGFIKIGIVPVNAYPTAVMVRPLNMENYLLADSVNMGKSEEQAYSPAQSKGGFY